MWIHFTLFLLYNSITNALECGDNSTTGCANGCAVNSCPVGSICVPRENNSFSCVNNSTCPVGADGVTCVCPQGFSGKSCEIFDGYCTPNPCLNAGKCEEVVDGYHCECNGWAGKNCEIPLHFQTNGPRCNSSSCVNNGTCSIVGNELFCSCSNGFTGQRCEMKINLCSPNPCPVNKACVELEASFECHCPPNLTGPDCTDQLQTCNRESCLNDGVCENDICKCKSGFSGLRCDIQSRNTECKTDPPCVNGICHMVDGVPECFCRAGFTGTGCTRDFDECLSVPCHNAGTCIDQINGYSCQCVPGYTGTNCEFDIDECEVKPCYNNASCVDGVNSYVCNCVAGFTGNDCETDIDECESQPCLNGGLCVDHVNAFTCNCTDTGFSGPFCENNIDDCEQANCASNSTCTDLIKDFKCNCYPGYTGKNCSIDIDECAEHPCDNDGLCLERSNESNYFTNYLGLFNTTFSYENASGYICHCYPGFRGENCSENINECESNPCINGACVDGINNYTCECLRGFEGTNCELEIDECDRFRPCFNGSACLNTVGDYVCDCPDDYGGKNCSVLLTGCRNNLCENNSTCHQYLIGETEQAYNCSCVHGFHGRHCEDITTMSLSGKRSVAMAIGRREEHKLRFRFRTTLPDGVLFVAENGDTFYSFMLEKSELVFTFGSTGSNTREFRFGGNLNDARWNAVILEMEASNVTVVVHGVSQSYSKLVNLTRPVEWGFENLVVGGAPESGLAKPKLFVGCLEDVIVNGDLVAASTLQGVSEVTEGCPRKEQCLEETCSRNGKCTDLWDTFDCECRRPFLGATCNKSYTPGTFGFENTTSLATVAFPLSTKLELKSNIKISAFIRTREESGLVFYMGNSDPLRDETSVALDVKSGKIRLFVKNGNERYTYSPLKTTINNGDNHLIEVVITRQMHFATNSGTILLYLNNTLVLNETANFPVEFQIEQLFMGSLPEKHSRLKRQQADWYDFVNPEGSEDKLGAHEYMTLTPFAMGGDNDGVTVDRLSNGFSATVNTVNREVTSSVPDLPPKQTKDENGDDSDLTRRRLKAVLQDVRVNDKLILFFPMEDSTNLPIINNVTLTSVKEGIVSDDVCKVNPCQHGAACKATYNDYICACPEGYRGKNCSLVDYCFKFSCPATSECQSLSDGYECISNATFDGETSFISYTSNLMEEVNTISFTYRSQHPGLILAATNSSLRTRFQLHLSEQHFQLVHERNDLTVTDLDLTTTLNLTDGSWHKVKLEFINSKIEFQIDSQSGSIKKTVESDLSATLLSEIIVGGHSDSMATGRFGGCLREVRINHVLLPFFLNEELVNDTSKRRFFVKEMTNVVKSECVLCFEHRCQNGGNCSDPYGSFDCSCYGFHGQFCKEDIDECGFTDCQNGTCENIPGSFKCICVPGFEGTYCDKDIDECQNHPCQNGGICSNIIGSYRCMCTSNYTGMNCEELVLVTCDNDPCQNGGICHPSDDHQKYKFNCTCPEGYMGRNCSEEKDFCLPGICNDGSCFNVPEHATVKCICWDGFDGDRCEINIDDCAGEPCENGGTCEDGVNSYTCVCGDGFVGRNCEHDINECELPYEICENGATCENSYGSFNCSCHGPFFGKTCSLEDPCETNYFCDNDGICENDEDNTTGLLYTCLCPEPYIGNHCQEKREAAFDANSLALILGPVVACVLIITAVAVTIFFMMARKKRATRGTYSPSRQEMFGSRVELGHVMKPPPEERLI